MSFSVSTHPLRGSLDFSYVGAKGSVSAAIKLGGPDWGVGFSASYHPHPDLSLKAYVKTNGFRKELGLSGHARFFRA